MPPVITRNRKALPAVAGLGIVALLLAAIASFGESYNIDPAGDPPLAEGGYVGTQTCKTCHNTEAMERRWDTWMNTKHADALATLESEWSARIAKDKGLKLPAHEAPECLRCHVTGHAALKKVPWRINRREGVQCESCHTPGAEHMRDAQRKWVEKDATADTGAHMELPDKSTCTACHNEESPTWDPARYTLKDGGTSGFDYVQAKRRAIHPDQDMRVESKPAETVK